MSVDRRRVPPSRSRLTDLDRRRRASDGVVDPSELVGFEAGAAFSEELPDGLLVLAPDGAVRLANSAALLLLQVKGDAADVSGQRLPDLVTLLDERGNDWWECSAPLLLLPGVQRQPERRLLLVTEHAEYELLATARYVRSGGAVQRVVVSLRGTESRERLERSRADLVSTVAHELRSPLTSVKGFTATLLAKWDRFSDEQKLLMLATVNADADRVTRLLSELLDVSRIDAGRLELRLQVVDVPTAVRRVVAGSVAAGEEEDRFRVFADEPLPEMWLDPDKLDQVLHNLVENALRHGDGTVTVRVEPIATPEPGAVVTVADEGDGIPEETVARVFTKFWRGGARRGGTGLGLFIAKGIVEAHGGTIAAGRSEAGGAEFRFTLPAGAPTYA
ncbi:MAG TPA: HAMP domain-containing sensor histidine kinase [Frankiaceae bacterium]|nr:HAMP domain-containing sensor histidine kinase [Frankiaceae bacterium]